MPEHLLFSSLLNSRKAKSVVVGFLALLVSCQRFLAPVPQLPESLPVVVEGVKPDSLAEATISPYRLQVIQKMEEVIGTAPAPLAKGIGESALGNFVTDLMLQHARNLSNGPVDLAVTNIGGLRVAIPEGEITVGHIYELMPFENELVVLTLSGTTLGDLFAYAATRRDAPMAGASYTIQNGHPHDIRINGHPFDPGKTYRVVTTDYFASGGDQALFFQEALATEKTGLTFRDAIIRHIRHLTARGQPVTAKLEGRVK